MWDDFRIGVIDSTICSAVKIANHISSNRHAFWYDDGLLRGKIARDTKPGAQITKVLAPFSHTVEIIDDEELDRQIREIVYTWAFKTLDFAAIDRCINRAFQNGLSAGRSEVRDKMKEALGL